MFPSYEDWFEVLFGHLKTRKQRTTNLSMSFVFLTLRVLEKLIPWTCSVTAMTLQSCGCYARTNKTHMIFLSRWLLVVLSTSGITLFLFYSPCRWKFVFFFFFFSLCFSVSLFSPLSADAKYLSSSFFFFSFFFFWRRRRKRDCVVVSVLKFIDKLPLTSERRKILFRILILITMLSLFCSGLYSTDCRLRLVAKSWWRFTNWFLGSCSIAFIVIYLANSSSFNLDYLFSSLCFPSQFFQKVETKKREFF